MIGPAVSCRAVGFAVATFDTKGFVASHHVKCLAYLTRAGRRASRVQTVRLGSSHVRTACAGLCASTRDVSEGRRRSRP